MSSPTFPDRVGFYETPGDSYEGGTVAGSFAYIASTDDLRILDVSVASAPIEVGFLKTAERADSVTVAGNIAYVADGDAGLRIIDVSQLSSPVEIGFYNTLGYAVDVAVDGTYAYVAVHGC